MKINELINKGWTALNRFKPTKLQDVNNSGRLRLQIDKNYDGAGRNELVYQYEKDGMLLIVPSILIEEVKE
jgi:hypothetical protein